jgi:hypothetical protein
LRRSIHNLLHQRRQRILVRTRPLQTHHLQHFLGLCSCDNCQSISSRALDLFGEFLIVLADRYALLLNGEYGLLRCCKLGSSRLEIQGLDAVYKFSIVKRLSGRRSNIPLELLGLNVEVSLDAFFELCLNLGAVGGRGRGHFSWCRQGSSDEAENSEGLHFRVGIL